MTFQTKTIIITKKGLKMVRKMTINDYENVIALWNSIDGFHIRNVDDSLHGMKKFLQKNPDTNAVYILDNQIVGTLLCGYDGRCAYMYHACVKKDIRKSGIGREMVDFVVSEIKKYGATSINLLVFKTNEIGHSFWKKMGYKMRDDLDLYEITLDSNNTRTII